MHSTLSLVALVAVASAAAIVPRVPADELLVTFWPNGCHYDDAGNAQTIVISEEGPTKPGDCVATSHTDWKTVELKHVNNDVAWEVEVFSGLGCNNPVGVYSEDSCYSAPQGSILQSIRASKK